MNAQETERAADALLASHGAFRRGTGIKSPRMLRHASRRDTRPPPEEVTPEPRTPDTLHLFASLARSANLTPDETLALYLHRVEGRGLAETAQTLDRTVHAVRQELRRALLKCRRSSSSAAELFSRTAAYRPARPAGPR